MKPTIKNRISRQTAELVDCDQVARGEHQRIQFIRLWYDKGIREMLVAPRIFPSTFIHIHPLASTFLWPLSVIFDILEAPVFNKYCKWWNFSALFVLYMYLKMIWSRISNMMMVAESVMQWRRSCWNLHQSLQNFTSVFAEIYISLCRNLHQSLQNFTSIFAEIYISLCRNGVA